MNEVEIAKKMLVSVGIAMTNAEKLMESEDEDVKIFALNAFTTLVEIELTLLTALDFNAEKVERNPLARRAQLDR